MSLNTFNLLDAEKDKLKVLFDTFEAHFMPQQSLVLQRHKLITCKQQKFQSIDNYVIDLKNLARNCELATLEDSLIKGIFICGVTSNELREQLLQDQVDSLQKAIDVAQRYEQAKKNRKMGQCSSRGRCSGKKAARIK